MKTLKLINDGSLILRKPNPHRKRSGIIEYSQRSLEYEAGIMGRAEVVGSLDPLYPVGSWVFVLQTGKWKNHGAGYGCLEDGKSLPEGTEFQIQGNPTIYISEGASQTRQNLFIKVKTTDPFGVATLKDDKWHLTPTNKSILVRVINPQAGSEVLQKAGIEKKSVIILPNNKDIKEALQQKGITCEGDVMSLATDANKELGLNPHSKVILLIQGAENNAADPGFDDKEWCIDGNPFIPKGYFDGRREQDVRSLPFLHLFAHEEDFMIEVV